MANSTDNRAYWVIGLALVLLVAGGLYWYSGKDRIGEKTVTNFDECVEAGYPVTESYPLQCRTPEGQTFTQDIGNELEKVDLIRIDNPRPNQIITSPLEITGEARGYWFFEASFPIKLLDADGQVIATGHAEAQGEWMTEDFVPYKATLNFTNPSTPKGTLVLEKDNPSGLPEHADELRVPVIFGTGGQATMKVKVYFNNDRMDPEFTCNKVFAVEREIPRTQAVARAAIEELLKGPTASEAAQGFRTSINTGVALRGISILNGTAKADFMPRLEEQVGGSCRVAAIRAEITETLKQFSTVDRVTISINGRVEGILQP